MKHLIKNLISSKFVLIIPEFCHINLKTHFVMKGTDHRVTITVINRLDIIIRLEILKYIAN